MFDLEIARLSQDGLIKVGRNGAPAASPEPKFVAQSNSIEQYRPTQAA